MKKIIFKIIKYIVILILAAAIIAGGYVLYGYASYDRLPDKLALETVAGAQAQETVADAGTEYTAVTYNIGFGAYLPDFGFFMDGGKSGRAKDKDSVIYAVSNAAATIEELDADFVFLQEVDFEATRSYHVDERELLRDCLPAYNSVFAQDYDSFYIMLPLYDPHGANKSCLFTMSRFAITSTVRRSLPISTSFSKFFDLDRCISISRTPVSNGKELVYINAHMSAYSTSEEVREGQTSLLAEILQSEYEAGNYVICAGDFNHDLKELDVNAIPVESWCYPYDRTSLPEHFSFAFDKLADEFKTMDHDSCRTADGPYNPDTSFCVTLDGFIVSDNITVTEYTNVDLQYAYSDHDPVCMKFILED